MPITNVNDQESSIKSIIHMQQILNTCHEKYSLYASSFIHYLLKIRSRECNLPEKDQ